MRTLHQTGRPILALGVGLLLGLSSLWMACSSDSSSGSSCAESRCSVGESRCFGDVVGTCIQGADGPYWDKGGCDEGIFFLCVDAECVESAVCLVAGKRECAEDGRSHTTCAADRMSKDTVTCADGESCQEGACVSDTCTTGDTRCGDGVLLTCGAGSNWSAEDCGGAEICTEDTEGARCEDRVCPPLQASCDGGTAVVCDVDGRSETRTPCAADEICEDGYCLTATCDDIAAGHAGAAAGGCVELCEAIFDPDSTDNQRECVGAEAEAAGLGELSCEPSDTASCVQCMQDDGISTSTCGELRTACFESSGGGSDDQDALGQSTDAGGGAPEDAGPEEVAPHPELEPISHISFKLSGIPNEFTLAAMADYQESDQRFVISASDGSRKLEINLAPVEGYTVGAWSDSDDSDSAVAVCYHDGSQNETPPEGAGCSVGFSHAAILYILSIDTNNGDGSRVTGNFVATLVDSSNIELEFTEGTFDVLHQ